MTGSSFLFFLGAAEAAGVSAPFFLLEAFWATPTAATATCPTRLASMVPVTASPGVLGAVQAISLAAWAAFAAAFAGLAAETVAAGALARVPHFSQKAESGAS